MENLPKERCTLTPRKICEPGTKLLPRVVRVQSCVKVPRETCDLVRSEGKKVVKPVLRWVCGQESRKKDRKPSIIMLMEGESEPKVRKFKFSAL